MKKSEFQDVVLDQLNRCEDMLVVKGSEYATDTDRLSNFRAAAAIQNTTMLQALGGMMVKHTVSIYDMIRSNGVYEQELWDEKITDHINYLLLLQAVLQETRNDDGCKTDKLF